MEITLCVKHTHTHTHLPMIPECTDIFHHWFYKSMWWLNHIQYKTLHFIANIARLQINVSTKVKTHSWDQWETEKCWVSSPSPRFLQQQVSSECFIRVCKVLSSGTKICLISLKRYQPVSGTSPKAYQQPAWPTVSASSLLVLWVWCHRRPPPLPPPTNRLRHHRQTGPTRQPVRLHENSLQWNPHVIFDHKKVLFQLPSKVTSCTVTCTFTTSGGGKKHTSNSDPAEFVHLFIFTRNKFKSFLKLSMMINKKNKINTWHSFILNF